MSTEHIRDEAEAARRTLGQLARRVQERRRDVEKELKGLDTETDHVLIGARGALRAIDDDREVALEELGQLDEILTPDDTDPEEPPAAPPAPAPPIPTPPSAPAPPVVIPPVPPVPPVAPPVTVVNPTPPSAPAPTVVTPPAETKPTLKERLKLLSKLGLVVVIALAIIGALIGSAIASATVGIHDNVVGFGHTLLVIFWYIGWILGGFGLGGLIGVIIAEKFAKE